MKYFYVEFLSETLTLKPKYKNTFVGFDDSEIPQMDFATITPKENEHVTKIIKKAAVALGIKMQTTKNDEEIVVDNQFTRIKILPIQFD